MDFGLVTVTEREIRDRGRCRPHWDQPVRCPVRTGVKPRVSRETRSLPRCRRHGASASPRSHSRVLPSGHAPAALTAALAGLRRRAACVSHAIVIRSCRDTPTRKSCAASPETSAGAHRRRSALRGTADCSITHGRPEAYRTSRRAATGGWQRAGTDGTRKQRLLQMTTLGRL